MTATFSRSFTRWFLYCRSIMWTVLFPGTVTVYIPYRMLSGSQSVMQGWGLLQILAVIPATMGVVILFHCIWSFAVIGHGTLSIVDAPRRLVVTGLYRFVRNPMYIGVLMVLLGETLFFQSIALFWYAVAFFLVANAFIIMVEERVLRRRFGESYSRYCQTVRRWWPRIIPIANAENHRDPGAGPIE